jgi:hypothetical protein
MIFDYQDALGVLSSLVAAAGYVFYFRDIFASKTKPHAFSWLVWAVLAGIAFAVEAVKHGGPGSWAFLVDVAACTFVFLWALFRGDRRYAVFDWIALATAGMALWLWWLTSDPTLSVVLITAVDVAGFLPTFRKTFSKPYEETAMTYALSALKFIIAIPALRIFTIATMFYPMGLIITNSTFVLLLIIRRKQLAT